MSRGESRCRSAHALTAVLLVVALAPPAFAQGDLPPDEEPTAVPDGEAAKPEADGQGAQPAEAPRPGPTPAPPPAQAAGGPPSPGALVLAPPRYSRYRSRWYIGFGFGGGAGWISTDLDESASEGGFSFLFRVGAIVKPWLLLGFELSLIRFQLADDLGYSFIHTDGLATLYPIYDRGFFLKGGFGVGALAIDDDALGGSSNETGFDLKLGAGWEFQLTRAMNLGFDLTYALIAFEAGTTNDLCAHGTLSWY